MGARDSGHRDGRLAAAWENRPCCKVASTKNFHHGWPAVLVLKIPQSFIRAVHILLPLSIHGCRLKLYCSQGSCRSQRLIISSAAAGFICGTLRRRQPRCSKLEYSTSVMGDLHVPSPSNRQEVEIMRVTSDVARHGRFVVHRPASPALDLRDAQARRPPLAPERIHARVRVSGVDENPEPPFAHHLPVPRSLVA